METKIPGAFLISDNECIFTVWAPEKEVVSLHLLTPAERLIPMEKDAAGYWSATVKTPAGSRYFYQVEGQDFPDPGSFYQPEGVHGPSEVIALPPPGCLGDKWCGRPLKELVFYELHIGTFTKEGTFAAAISRLDDLARTGITAVEIMPVAQFPGSRNWGYDGVFSYAVQNSYGGPKGLKQFVDACHRRKIAVFLDVVYNHLGPEGNYLSKFGPYFTDKYKTPWGDALNFDGEWSDGVKNFFLHNILFWFRYFQLDGLRLDAVHAIFDNSAYAFWGWVHEGVTQLEQERGQQHYLIAESDLNDPKVVKDPDLGGWGLDALWLDDFHHALYVLLDEKGKRRYADFGSVHQLAKAYKDGFVHSGEYVSFRKRSHGKSSAGISGEHFVAFNQNHDQIGNRIQGERLASLISEEKYRLAAACLLLAPYLPLLFMGEEYGEDTPFFYFVSHSDKNLIEAVRHGRKKEFETFIQAGEDFPDPQDEATFEQSVIEWKKRDKGKYKKTLDWYETLLRLRRENSVLRNFDKGSIQTGVVNNVVLTLLRATPDGLTQLYIAFNFSATTQQIVLPDTQESWRLLLDSKDFGKSQKSKSSVNWSRGEAFRIQPWAAIVFASSKSEEQGDIIDTGGK